MRKKKKNTSTPLLITKTDIRGILWSITVFAPNEYPETESLARCIPSIWEIQFSHEHISEAIVRHELLHAYIASSLENYEDVNLLEEQCAEIFEHFGPKMVRDAKRIYKKIIKVIYENN